MKTSIFILILTMLVMGCAPKQKRAEQQPKSYRFRYVQPPAQATTAQKMEYMRDHYWDKFDFADSLYTTKADTTEMLRAYATFVSVVVGKTDQEPIRQLMQRASTSKSMFSYFSMLAEKVLHDPNSPYRNDELYIAVLEEQLNSPLLDKYEKIAPKYDLRLVSQNRIGHKANNFEYIDSKGRRGNMHSLKSDFIILYINNPGCTMCREITQALKQSQIISDLQRKGKVKILAIYPDENLDEWHKHLADMPAEWINSYDKGCHIDRENLYNINAIPSLYLLDKEKKVLVKDSTNVGEIEEMLFRSFQPQN